MTQSKYKQGFKFFLKKRVASNALRNVLIKDTRRRVRKVIKERRLPLTCKATAGAFRKMSLRKTCQVMKDHVPFLHELLATAMTAMSGRGEDTR